MTKPANQNAPKGHPAFRAKVVILTALVLLGALVGMMLTVQRTPADSWWIPIALLLCGVHVYLGAPWARWIVGIALALAALGWVMGAWPGGGPTWRSAILMVPAVGVLLVAGQLMFSKAVRSYAAELQARQNALVTKLVKTTWIVLLLGMAVTMFRDLQKLL